MINSVLGLGQIHAFHMLFKEDPRLAVIVLILLVALAYYFQSRR